ncbi:urea transporter [Streptomyces xanthii]|uniref:Urea transporter n=1 Tax=Streptomyces xanthii TaxID=2768069 RepID=A0A7H1BEH7_9ACTN|nr:urea transporter [Streptomyces xanthii]QNS07132.1 urea transporter [Streptomyces xanthii]
MQFALRVLRGLGQVTFVPRALTGALFVVALFAAGWEYGLYGLGGAVVGTAIAALLGVERERVTQGLEGFNSCLVGVSCAVFLRPERPATVLVALLGCAVVTVVTAAAGRALDAWGLPALTLPFCAVASAVALAAPAFPRVWTGGGLAALPGPVELGAKGPGPAELAQGFLAGFGQIFLMPQWYVGAFVFAGLLAAGPRVAGVAALGNLVGMVTAGLLGTPAERLAEGTSGYNAILVALALGGVFLEFGPRTLVYALAGAAASTAFAPALGALAAPAGGHALTWPFVLTTLAFLAAARSFPTLTERGSGPAPAQAGPDPRA